MRGEVPDRVVDQDPRPLSVSCLFRGPVRLRVVQTAQDSQNLRTIGIKFDRTHASDDSKLTQRLGTSRRNVAQRGIDKDGKCWFRLGMSLFKTPLFKRFKCCHCLRPELVFKGFHIVSLAAWLR